LTRDIFNAIRADDADEVRRLIEAEPALLDALEEGFTPLACAAASGADSVVHALLDAGVPPNPPDGSEALPPIVAAAAHGQGQTAETLLIHGAHVDARDPTTGATPLLVAATAGDAERVRQLIHWGADLEATDPEGLTAFQIAHRAGDEAVMKRLLDGGAVDTPAPEPERVAIRYSVVLDDALAFSAHYANTSPMVRARYRRYLIIYPTLFMILGIIYALRHNSIQPLVVPALLSAAFIGWVLFGSKRFYLWRVAKIYASAPNKTVFCEHEMELLPGVFIERTALNENRASLATIDRIVTTDSHVFIHIGAGIAHIIPRDKIIEGDLDDFVARLTERWEAQREEPAEESAAAS